MADEDLHPSALVVEQVQKTSPLFVERCDSCRSFSMPVSIGHAHEGVSP